MRPGGIRVGCHPSLVVVGPTLRGSYRRGGLSQRQPQRGWALPVDGLFRSVKRGQHLKDRHAVLTGRDPAGIERTAIASRLHHIFDVDSDPTALDEVGVQRLWQPSVVNSGAGGGQGLGGDQPTEQPAVGAHQSPAVDGEGHREPRALSLRRHADELE